jgi:hypothetical protein
MAIDFPSSPIVGQQFTGGSTNYQWDGTAWNIVPQIGPMYIGDTPPSNPAIGQQWWRSSNGQQYLWYDDGNTKQWVQSAGAAAAAALGSWETLFTKTYTGGLIGDIVRDLAPYREIKFTIDGRAVGVDTVVLANPSTDNGSTFITTAGAFPLDQLYSISGGAPSYNTSAQSGLVVANPVPANTGVNSGFGGDMTLYGFNTTLPLKMGQGRSAYIDNSSNRVNNSWATFVSNSNAWNALKLSQSGGTGFIGFIAVQGMRG